MSSPSLDLKLNGVSSTINKSAPSVLFTVATYSSLSIFKFLFNFLSFLSSPPFVSDSGTKCAMEFVQNALIKMSMPFPSSVSSKISSLTDDKFSWNRPAKYPSTTFILFCVSVPVLSEQMFVAPPIVSHAAKCLTRLLSFIISFTEYAKAMVTASGNPSGTATTTTVTAITIKDTTSDKSDNDQFPVPFDVSITFLITNPISKIKNVSVAKNTPIFPIVAAKSSSFSSSGVCLCPPPDSSSSVLPHSEFVPTAVTNISPVPSFTVVPDNKNGSFAVDFFIISDSPVMDDSSVSSFSDSNSIPSAGTASPFDSLTMSPTVNWSTFTSADVSPFLITLMSMFPSSASNSLNFFSFFASLYAVTKDTMNTAANIASPSIAPNSLFTTCSASVSAVPCDSGNASPNTMDMIAMNIRMISIVSFNALKKNLMNPTYGACGITFCLNSAILSWNAALSSVSSPLVFEVCSCFTMFSAPPYLLSIIAGPSSLFLMMFANSSASNAYCTIFFFFF
mmetsp:Transcript_10487/g.15333  ORF Transcript_10487/g.15333 Transcript_10487/m.15333 type:complete len:507 (-) Transcript_10487:339-1859(-)